MKDEKGLTMSGSIATLLAAWRWVGDDEVLEKGLLKHEKPRQNLFRDLLKEPERSSLFGRREIRLGVLMMESLSHFPGYECGRLTDTDILE
jgi:hypothetical protein